MKAGARCRDGPSLPWPGILLLCFGLVVAPPISEERVREVRKYLAPVPGIDTKRFDAVLRYHFRSKHFFDMQADIPVKQMDPATQPSPWRSYDPAPAVQLPWDVRVEAAEGGPSLLNLSSIGSFLRLSAAISAWKSYDAVHMWALRVPPSSGNLQTTEVHIILPIVGGGLADVPGTYHYHPEQHVLELLNAAPIDIFPGDGDSSDAPCGFLVALTSLCVREAWKYGERALRSCHLNIGHFAAAIAVASELHGWRLGTLPSALLPEKTLATILSIPQAPKNPHAAQEETPELVLLVETTQRRCQLPGHVTAQQLSQALQAAEIRPALGQPASISPPGIAATYQRWTMMDSAARASAVAVADMRVHQALLAGDRAQCMSHLMYLDDLTPSDIILRRRSAQKFVANSPSFPLEAFAGAMKAMCSCASSFGASPQGHVHVLLMVHNVESMDPGLYILARSKGDASILQSFAGRGLSKFRPNTGSMLWKKTLATLDGLGCKLLTIAAPVDVRQAAQVSACNQEVAGQGVFATAFVGRFDGWTHPRRYAELHWEAGALSHVLYLAAHAVKMRATGIGCFFDDFALSLLRSPDMGIDAGASASQAADLGASQFQVLYMTTVGQAEVDDRLLSFEPYHHLQEGYAYERMHGGVGRVMPGKRGGVKEIASGRASVESR